MAAGRGSSAASVFAFCFHILSGDVIPASPVSLPRMDVQNFNCMQWSDCQVHEERDRCILEGAPTQNISSETQIGAGNVMKAEKMEDTHRKCCT